MAKHLSEMSDEEIQAEISRLQGTKVPSARPPKTPKRLDEARPKRKSWKDDFFKE